MKSAPERPARQDVEESSSGPRGRLRDAEDLRGHEALGPLDDFSRLDFGLEAEVAFYLSYPVAFQMEEKGQYVAGLDSVDAA